MRYYLSCTFTCQNVDEMFEISRDIEELMVTNGASISGAGTCDGERDVDCYFKKLNLVKTFKKDLRTHFKGVKVSYMKTED